MGEHSADRLQPQQSSADGPKPPRGPLRLPGSPRVTSHGYLRLEDVINAVGTSDHPTEWGQLPGWEHMPFRWSRSKKRYVRYELKIRDGCARLRAIPVKLDLDKAQKRACTSLYRRVRATIRHAFETGKLTAYAVHIDMGKTTQMSAPAVWLKQSSSIFFVGRTKIRQRQAPDILAEVVIERSVFDAWMSERANQNAKVAGANASRKVLEDAGDLIAKHARRNGYGIARTEAFKLTAAAAARHNRIVSRAQFEKHAWEQYDAKAGRRKTKAKAQYELHRDGLKAELAALFEKASAPGPMRDGETVRQEAN